MKNLLWQPRYFIVTLIAVALVVLGVRLESLAQSLFYGTPVETFSTATAEDEPAKDKPAEPEAEKPAEKPAEAVPTAEPAKDDAAKTATADKSATDKPAAEKAEAEPPPSPRAAPLEEMSQGEMEVLKQLSGRRAALDQREQELLQKTAILQAAEMRVDQKVKDLEKLRTQLQAMLGQVTEEQQTQLDNLVKMYEVMKPKEAARILQTLDMSVLLGIMRQMKPAKSAPILAEMEALKAKEITLTLAKQHDLPDTKAVTETPKPAGQ